MQLFRGQHAREFPRVIFRVTLFPLARETRRKLISARFADQPEQLVNAVVVLAEISGQLLQQFRIRRLRIPALRQLFGVKPRQIEFIPGLHQPHAHQLRPEHIHGGSGELRIRRNHPAQFFARLCAGLRRFIGKQKLRRIRPPVRFVRSILSAFVL